MTTRLSVNINDDTEAALKKMAERRQTSVTEIVRRAVSILNFVEDSCVTGNKRLKLVEEDGSESYLQVL